MSTQSKYLFQDEQEIKFYQDGWSIVGNAPVTKEMFDEYGIEDLSVIDNEAIQQLESDGFELLCWTEEPEEGKVRDIVPTLTEGSTMVSASSVFNSNANRQPYNAFDDKNDEYSWTSLGPSGWIQIEFDTPRKIDSYSLTSRNMDSSATSNGMPKDWKLEGSNDGENFDVIDSISEESGWGIGEKREYPIASFPNEEGYRFIRLNVSNNNGHEDIILGEVEFLQSEKVQVESKRLRIEAVPHGQLAMPVEDIEIDGKVEIEVLEDGEETSLIPAMTNSTSPSGIVSHSSAWSPDHQGWEVFDKKKELSSAWATAGGSKSGWVQYDFQKPVIVSKYVLTSRENTSGESPRDWTFEGSNDGTNWTVLDTITGETGWTSFEDREYYIDNTNAYQIYRLNISNNNGHTFIALCELDMIEIKNPGIIRIIASNDSGLSWRGKEEVDITNTSTIIEHGWTAQELNNLTEEELQSVFPEGKGRLAFYLEKDNTTDIAEIKSITINQRTYTITPSVESVSVLYDLLEGEGSSIYVSRNDGIDWLPVSKDELVELSSLPEGKDLRVKVILEDGQELHGLSYSWI